MTPDAFEGEVRRRLHDLADHAPSRPSHPATARDAPGGPRLDQRPGPPRPNGPRVAVAAAVVVVAAALVGASTLSGDDPDPAVITDSSPPSRMSSTTSPAPAPGPPRPATAGAVATVPSGPGYGTILPVVVWTGDELIVWGGEVISEQEWSDRGGAYDPVAQTWRELAPAPLPPMSGHTAIWTGEEVVICCGRVPAGSGAVAAAYRPATDSWRSLAPPPLRAASPAVSVWTGAEMIVTGGNDFQGAAAYDPWSDTWRALSSPPGIIERGADASWTGHLLVVWDRYATAGFTYDPRTDSWDRLPELPEDLRLEGGTAAVVGNELLVWGAEQRADGIDQTVGVRLDLEDRRWRALPAAPVEAQAFSEVPAFSPSSTVAGSEVIVATGGLGSAGEDLAMRILAFDPGTETWRRLGTAPYAYAAPMVWADGTAFLLGAELLAITP